MATPPKPAVVSEERRLKTLNEDLDRTSGAFAKAASAGRAFVKSSLGASIDSLKNKVSAFGPAVSQMGAGLSSLIDPAADATAAFSQMGQAISSGLQAGVDKVSAALKGLGPEGQAAAAVLEIYATVIFGVAGALWEMSKAAYAVIDQREDWITLFDALGKGEGAGQATLAQIDKLAKELPFATAKIADWAKGLMAAGISADDLESSIKAVAAAQALMGDAGGAAAQKMIKQLAEGGAAADKMLKAIQEGGPKSARMLAEMGLHVEDIAEALGMTPEAFKKAKIGADEMRKGIEKALQKKGAGALENMMGDMPVILMKVKEGVMSLFEKLGKPMGKLMAAIQKLFSQFYKGTPTMKFLQGVVTTVFTFIFKYATMAINGIRSVLTGIGPAVKKVTTFLAPLIGILKAIFTNATVLKGIKTIFMVIGAVLLTVIAIVAVFGAMFAAVGIAVGVVIAAIGTAIAWVAGVIGEAVDAISGFFSGLVGESSSVGGSITDGLVGGLDIGAFVSKMAGMASAGLAAFKGVLGIASPSKVMMQMGEHTAGGAATGIDKGAAKVESASAQMGAGAANAAGGSMGGAKGAPAGAKSLTLNVYIDGHRASATVVDMADAFEQMASMQGLTLRATP